MILYLGNNCHQVLVKDSKISSLDNENYYLYNTIPTFFFSLSFIHSWFSYHSNIYQKSQYSFCYFDVLIILKHLKIIKVCPMEKCQRMQVDSFVRTLPPYMRASPFMHFEQTYDDYETCSPGNLLISFPIITFKSCLRARRV